MLSTLVEMFWLSPFAYTTLTLAGQILYRIRRKRLGRRGNLSRVIMQIPTIGNVDTTNTIIGTVKGYGVRNLETWVLIDEQHYKHDMVFECDRLIIVPKTFETGCQYKSRSLEYARILRNQLYEAGELDDNYIVIQCDDDSTPSHEFIEDALTVDADLIIGTITPRPVGHLIADYERPVACHISCLVFTNIGWPVWGHGEGMVISSRVDRNISYEPRAGKPLISSEDLYYLHKTAYSSLAEDKYIIDEVARNGYRIFASKERVYITPPLSISDAVKQRRRWMWGHIRLIKYRILNMKSAVTVFLAETVGMATYAIATLGAVLAPLGLITIPAHSIILSYISLVLWHVFRGFSIARVMGLKLGVVGMLLSFATVSLNFAYHVAGLIKGDPRRFDVIRKYIPK